MIQRVRVDREIFEVANLYPVMDFEVSISGLSSAEHV
jgi:hypothetical protein